MDLDDDDFAPPPATLGERMRRWARRLARGLGRLLLAVVCVLLIVWGFLLLEQAPTWLTLGVAVLLPLAGLAIVRTAHRRGELPPSPPDAVPDDEPDPARRVKHGDHPPRI
jgi:hypothetical protein